MFVSVLARRLRPGTTYEEFLAAWYPDHGFGFPGRGPILARDPHDDREILAFGFLDLPDVATLDRELVRLAEQEAARHERLSAVVESTSLRGIYEITGEFDFSTDEAVARTRPTQD